MIFSSSFFSIVYSDFRRRGVLIFFNIFFEISQLHYCLDLYHRHRRLVLHPKAIFYISLEVGSVLHCVVSVSVCVCVGEGNRNVTSESFLEHSLQILQVVTLHDA